MSTSTQESDMQDLLHISDCARIPRTIMTFLVEAELVATSADIRLISTDDVTLIQDVYAEKYADDPDKLRIWTRITTGRFKYLIEWFNSFHRTYGRAPTIPDIEPENFNTLPEEVASSVDRLSHLGNQPNRPSSGVTFRRSSMMSMGSQAASKRNVKVSIADYPKFSGKAKDWITFERKFRSVASSQGFDHILQEKEYQPMNQEEEKQYEMDLAFIYDAFQNVWADATNFYLVEKNKKQKNGRQVYLDAVNYFRGAAVKDAILTENMDTLVNFKLTHTTPNGAEGFNNKFNDIVNSLEQQGHTLAPPILKGIFLGNIQDKVYENIKDQAAANDKMKLPEIQSQILQKYLSIQGERRATAPKYTHKRFVNTLNSKHVHFQADDDYSEEDNPDMEEEYLSDDQGRSIYTSKSRKPRSSNSTPKPGFPLLPKDQYDALSEDVKNVLRQQHTYYRDQIKALQKQTPGRTMAPRAVNLTHTMSIPDDMYDIKGTEDEEEDNTATNGEIPPDDPVLTTFQQFLHKARTRHIKVCHTSRKIDLPWRAINAHFVRDDEVYGRLISDNAADTGSLSPKYCHIVHTSPQQVLVNGCHPTLTKSYHLGSGITAVDLPSGTILIGQHEVPVIPDSDIMLVSETQARCSGIDIDSKSRRFGGRGSIILDDETIVPLRLEHALMTCPIRMPTPEELHTLPVHWLTANAPWDPTTITDPLDPTLLVPLGYSSSLGTLDLLDLDLDPHTLQPPSSLSALGEDTSTGETEDEISQALRYLNLSSSTLLVHQSTPALHPFAHYQPFLGWKPIEIIKKTFEATTQWATTPFNPPLK